MHFVNVIAVSSPYHVLHIMGGSHHRKTCLMSDDTDS